MKNYAERGAIKEESGSIERTRAALEEGAERLKRKCVTRTSYINVTQERASGGREQREGAEGSRAEERKRREAERKQREEPLWAIGSAEKLGYLISCHEAPTVGAMREGRIRAVLTSRFLLKSRFSMRYYERLMVSLWVGLQQQ